MIISATLKKHMYEHDINLSQLSRATRVPRQTLDNWLSGQEPKSLKQVKNVADHFDYSLDQFCFGIAPKSSGIEELTEEINAGVFEVVLRRIKK